MDQKQQPISTQDTDSPNITNDNGIPGKDTDPAGEKSESDQKTIVSPVEHSTGPTAGLAPEVLQPNVDHTSVDMEEKPMAAQDGKRPNITNNSELPRKDTDPAGEKSESDQKTIVSPKEHSTGSLGDLMVLYESHALEVLQSNVDHSNVVMEEKPMAAHDGKRSHITNDSELPGKDTDPAEARLSALATQDTKSPNSTNDNVILGKGTDPAGEKVNVHVLVAGETFQTHDTFIQKLKLQIELCSAESSNVILVFCPVVSRIGTDMEAAMDRVTVNKPVILVFMHHCHNPRHMTNTTVQPCRSNIVQVVHCAFHETKGLLECQENEQAVDAVDSTLLRFCRSVDVHNEIPQSKVTVIRLDMEQQPMGTQNAKRPYNSDSELHGQSTESVETTGLSSPREFSQCLPSPKKRKYSSLVKVHVLVAGETFSTHDTFIKKLESEIELCSSESSSVILVFCPVVSRIGTDMEAAMNRVIVDKPVILVFMHHCHNPSHMTNIIVQPCRSNIVQVVHCAFHETRGLLQCQENEQAVAEVQEKLKKYK